LEVKYNKARELLIAKGWKPVIMNSMSAKFDPGQIAQFKNSGFVEIYNCTSTGAPPCVLYFENKEQEKLKVITIGESNFQGDDFPAVSSYELVDRIPGLYETPRHFSPDSAKIANQTQYSSGTNYLAEVTCSLGERNLYLLGCFVNIDLKPPPRAQRFISRTT
jgi:hypothetical protein